MKSEQMSIKSVSNMIFKRPNHQHINNIICKVEVKKEEVEADDQELFQLNNGSSKRTRKTKALEIRRDYNDEVDSEATDMAVDEDDIYDNFTNKDTSLDLTLPMTIVEVPDALCSEYNINEEDEVECFEGITSFKNFRDVKNEFVKYFESVQSAPMVTKRFISWMRMQENEKNCANKKNKSNNTKGGIKTECICGVNVLSRDFSTCKECQTTHHNGCTYDNRENLDQLCQTCKNYKPSKPNSEHMKKNELPLKPCNKNQASKRSAPKKEKKMRSTIMQCLKSEVAASFEIIRFKKL